MIIFARRTHSPSHLPCVSHWLSLRCVVQIGELMERDGIRFIHPASPVELSSGAKVAPPSDAEQVRPGVWQLPSTAPNTRTLLYASGAKESIDMTTGRSSWQFPGGPITVSYVYNTGDTSVQTEQFDTVLLAVGRQANVADLHLDKGKPHGTLAVCCTSALASPYLIVCRLCVSVSVLVQWVLL